MAERDLFRLTGAAYDYQGAPALAGVDLVLRPGCFHGILGPNGSGKSTLLDLLIGEKRPAAGHVLFKGDEVAALGRKTLARELALVPQEFQVRFAFTVREVVMMGRHPHQPRFGAPSAADHDMVGRAMAAIGVDHLAGRLVTGLSGGEKQRVAVARALAQDTPVLLLDEATSNLDVKCGHGILNLMRNFVRAGNRTVIAVLHNLNLAAAFCDEVTLLKKGRVHSAGAVADTLTAAAIRDVFGVETCVRLDPFSGVPQISYRYFDEEKTRCHDFC